MSRGPRDDAGHGLDTEGGPAKPVALHDRTRDRARPEDRAPEPDTGGRAGPSDAPAPPDGSGIVEAGELARALDDGAGEAMNVTAAGLTDVGLQREHNEDSFVVLDDHHLYVVADGMGGHRAGDVASKMATDAIASFFEASANEDATWPFHFDPQMSVEENRLVTGIKLANKRIHDTSSRHAEVHGMGTTVVALVLSPDHDKLYVAHVGDSRCYRVREGEIALLTQDHSLVNDYLRFMPDMSDAQKDELPKNVITRALGMYDSVLVDRGSDDVRPGDRYVLCSDGLSGMIDDAAIRDTVVEAGADVEAAAQALVTRANDAGGEDNVTAIVVAVD